MKKLTLLTGLAAGYVLGTRDGRARYEQIKERAATLWNDPKVRGDAGPVPAPSPVTTTSGGSA